MTDGFISIGGYLNVIAGQTLLVYWHAFAIFLSYRDLSTTLAFLVKNRQLAVDQRTRCLRSIGGSSWTSGHLHLSTAESWFVGGCRLLHRNVGNSTAAWHDPVGYDIVADPVNHDESLLSYQGLVYLSRSFLTFFVASRLIYSAGFVLVGIGIVQGNTLPAAAGYLVAVGAPLFGLGAMFSKYQVCLRSAGVTLMGIGLLRLGLAMFS